MNTAQRYRPLGFQQLTGMTSAGALTVPAGAVVAVMSADTAGVRFRDDGTVPTSAIGVLIPAGTVFEYSGNLAALSVIQAAGSAVLNVSYYAPVG